MPALQLNLGSQPKNTSARTCAQTVVMTFPETCQTRTTHFNILHAGKELLLAVSSVQLIWNSMKKQMPVYMTVYTILNHSELKTTSKLI